MSEMRNLVQLFEASVNKRGDLPCFQYSEKGEWKTLNWLEVRSKVQSLAAVLKDLGVERGDRVVILSRTRYEWTVADMAIMTAGGATVPIYESNTADQVEYILKDSTAKVVFVENAVQLKKVKEAWGQVPGLKAAILIESQDRLLEEGKVLSLRECLLQANGKGADIYEKAIKENQPQDLASIVYTSGTTGNPKGAILHHDNFLSAIEGGTDVLHFRADQVGLLFLPLAHILGRVTQFYQIGNGFVHAYAESIEKLVDNISTVRPHFMVSVPRIFEKIHGRTLQNVEVSSPLKQKIFRWSLKVGCDYSTKVLSGRRPSFLEGLKRKIAHVLVFSKLHKKLGGRMEFFVSGGAPLARDVSEFFEAFGITILEGYGLTETTAANAVNRFDQRRVGTVGLPLPGVHMKIANDGEILIRGRCVFHGYFNNAEASQGCMTSDGWFQSGDIGEFDQDGFLKITDRKKDIIITAGGKNVAPQNIENLIKADPYISQVVVHGDKRKFLSALVTLDQAEVERYAKEHKIDFAKYDELIKAPAVYDLVKKSIDSKNSALARYETIKKFAILPSDFSVESGELTPTLKVKRKVINQRYKDIFDGFYRD